MHAHRNGVDCRHYLVKEFNKNVKAHAVYSVLHGSMYMPGDTYNYASIICSMSLSIFCLIALATFIVLK